MTIQQQLLRQRALLQLEYEAEKQAYEELSRQMGVRRKVKRGDAWCPVRVARTFYNSLNQPCVEITRQVDGEAEHNFEFSRPVVFFRMGEGEARFLPVRATVSYAENERMVVVLSDMSQAGLLRSSEALGVQLYFDESTYRLMFESLDKVMKAKGNRLAYLRDLFYSNNIPAQTFSFAPIGVPWLNPTQEKAVNEVLRAKDVMVVHGPPGTGKTTTLVEAIHETLLREPQVMVCAQSNMAVDWISEKLVDRGIRVLRIGNPVRVNDKMLGFTYERRFEAHPDYPALWAIRKSIRQLRSNRKSAGQGCHQQLNRLQDRAAELEVSMRQQLFAEARVVACTLSSSANQLLAGMKFSTLFIDEAAQALEAACWTAIRKCSRVILAGDHCQLPPTLKSHEALREGLGRTLMERIVDNKPQSVSLLEVQYRMNEKIMRFSSDWFYDGRLQSDPSVRDRGILDLDEPMQWIDTHGEEDGGEEFVGESFGRINRREARLTLQHLETYFLKIGKQRILDERIDVGVISPYRAQVQHLRQLIQASAFFKPFRHLVSVNTVDGFQGQERDIIFISLVRSNAGGEIGFLADLRRMNVAITRARMKLIILGDAGTLCKHRFYRQLYGQCAAGESFSR
ncbi:MAG: AAA domain-containing protein [Bacteroidaceae bacterium]|nr:AAA domain-containing protein [Prevotellaceae bacterium]MDY5631949.1 AAA domain-containing protein [Bacteroidaceae bacterium]